MQNSDGSFKSGHNGPWMDRESNVRNTAHISLILFRTYEIGNNMEFLNASKRACEFLLMDKNRPYKKNVLSRYSGDSTNGIIGPAWAIEPLIYIGNRLQEPRYLDFAEEIVLLHKFNRKRKLWHISNLNGSVGKIDETFNHQLWFAYVALTIGNIKNNKIILNYCNEFFNGLENNLTFLEKGLIEHTFRRKGFKYIIKKRLIDLYELIKGNVNTTFKRSRGYLGFNLQGFALAYYFNPEMKFWSKINKKIMDSMDYAMAHYPMDLMSGDESYGWAYNPTGIEIAFALQCFNKIPKEKEIIKWLNVQLNNYYDFGASMMAKNTCDPVTSSARFYESIFLDNYDVFLNNK
jgi:hypothetical protein